MRRALFAFAMMAVLICRFTGLAYAQEEKRAIRLEQDVLFAKAGETELKLDLAMPQEGEGPFPAVLCLHGGGWVGGERAQMAQTIRVLAGRGYVAVSPSYRLAPRNHFPAPLEDCKAAVRWLRANARKYMIDPSRIGAVGFSAGGHLACLLGVTDKTDELEGSGGHPEESSRVQAVVSFFGPTDLTRRWWTKEIETTNLLPLLGGTLEEKPATYKQASPIAYVNKNAAAFLFFHGTEDKTVPLSQSQALADKLKEAGASARLVALEGEGHGWRGDKLLKSLEQMVEFLDENLKK
ncbi:MAG TPA: alpha/beta hydrolase [Gemmataceae bacterium]|nr:alpha/beta hydrolase [Gemmataceae bacterium]